MSGPKSEIVLITGAAGGIGSAVAKHLAAAGMRLALVDCNEEALQTLCDELNLPAADILASCTDVSDEQAVTQMVTMVEQHFGAIDYFFNNAAIEGEQAPIEQCPVEILDKVLAINVRGVWLGLKHVIPVMRRSGGGSIVITSSVAGSVGSPGLSAYVASKHAVTGIMRTAAIECADAGIRVNSIHPGLVDTEMAARIGDGSSIGQDEFHALMRSKIPLARLADSQDICGMVAFLFSDAASYCTGSTYFIDGGICAGN